MPWYGPVILAAILPCHQDPTKLIVGCVLMLGGARPFALHTSSLAVVYCLYIPMVIALGTMNTAITTACSGLAAGDQLGGLYGHSRRSTRTHRHRHRHCHHHRHATATPPPPQRHHNASERRRHLHARACALHKPHSCAAGVLESVESVAGMIGPALGGLLAAAHPHATLTAVCASYGAAFVLVLLFFERHVVRPPLAAEQVKSAEKAE